MPKPWRRPRVKPQTCRACRRMIQEGKKGSLHRDGASYKAGALGWKTCSGFLQRMRIRARMRLPRTDMTKTQNWRFLHLAFRNLLAQMVVVVAPATIKYMAARLRRPTQYLPIRHSLSSHDETKTATRYFLYLSRYPRPILRAYRTDRQHHALRRVAYRSGVSNQSIQGANHRLHASDDTQRQARRGDKPTKTNSHLRRTHQHQATLFYSPRRVKP